MGRKKFEGLLVMATLKEAELLLEDFNRDARNFRLYRGKNSWKNWLLLITGLGMVNTALHTARILSAHSFQMALNAGVAGSFNPQIPLGQVAKVAIDYLTELGAESANHLLSLKQLNLLFPEQYPLDSGTGVSMPDPEDFFPEKWCSLPSLTAATVNTVHGQEASIETFKNRFSVDLESMEGAAFMLTCREFKIPFMQIRAVSNYVEPRNPSAWRMPLALARLNEVLVEGIKQIKP